MGQAVGRVSGEAVRGRVSREACAGAEALAGADGAGPLRQVLRVQAISLRAVFGPDGKRGQGRGGLEHYTTLNHKKAS